MAPEMIKNSPHDFKLDIWCLGVLLYELIHGNPPFKGKTENEKFKSILNNGAISFDEKISPEARDLIHSILKSNPNDRPSMDQLFHHSWMMQFEKSYKIKIDKYIWKEENSSNPNANNESTMNSFGERKKLLEFGGIDKPEVYAAPLKKGLDGYF